MISIKCVNPNCTSPSKTFDWDEQRELEPGGSIAQPNELAAVRVAVGCPYCRTENSIWLKGMKKPHRVVRKVR